MDDVEVPQFFLCPISLQIMRDPVTTITGITYDRDSIEQWLFAANNATCPATQQPLPTGSDLTPNHTLRRLIQSWCADNSSRGIDRIPSPKSPLNKSHLRHVITRDLWVPKSQLPTLRKLEALLVEKEGNMKCMVESGLAKAMVAFVIACHKKGQTAGLEEAMSILYLIRTDKKAFLFEKDDHHQIIDALTWVLRLVFNNHVTVKYHAVSVLKALLLAAKASSSINVMERLTFELFERLAGVVRDRMVPQQGVNAALQVMLDSCPWGRNRAMMVEAGAVFDLVDLELGSPEKRTTELVLGILFHLCSSADGRAQFLSHAGGLAVVTKRLLKVSPAATDRAMLIISLISKFSAAAGTSVVVEEMVRVGTVTRLCMVLQADCASYLKDKAREILRAHSHVWRNSPCFQHSLLTS